ncbi:ABC transporter ATP-binding protein [Streptococcus pneumoniae]|nr:ABC transporter ATP-binding protein [Streptococcus pneumoniae]
MKEFYKKRFALTDGGARNLSKATLASFFVYCINMLPAILLMIFAQEVLENMGKSNGFYIVFSVLILIAMYILLSIEYDKLYNTTYQESADLRIRTAENLSKLPLSYFSKHDISDISQTIMADIEGIEHAMSHSIPKVGGMVLFFPLISVMMLAGNVKMGLAVIIPSILSFIFIPLSKKYQVNGQNRYYDVLRKNSESFQENIEMQMEIKAYNLSKDIKDDLYKKMEDSEKVHLKAEVTTILTLSISSIFSFISLAVVIFVGVNLIINKEINSLYLFDKVSIVFQDVVLFNQSVMENIRIGKQDASDEEVKRAAKLANCTDFIEKMDKGFDTVIGENGAELSGGERQRLSIARAFLKDAPILILDEITASLDVNNEKKIQESLNNLVKDKTVVIISHRMKSIENADKIVVLQNGRVESEGKHEELLQKSKIYKNLIEKTKMAEEFIY